MCMRNVIKKEKVSVTISDGSLESTNTLSSFTNYHSHVWFHHDITLRDVLLGIDQVCVCLIYRSLLLQSVDHWSPLRGTPFSTWTTTTSPRSSSHSQSFSLFSSFFFHYLRAWEHVVPIIGYRTSPYSPPSSVPPNIITRAFQMTLQWMYSIAMIPPNRWRYGVYQKGT